MIGNKRTTTTAVIAMFATVFASSAWATHGSVSGVPLRMMANSVNSKYVDSFDVNGVSSFGTCPTDSNGYISVSIPLPGTVGSNDPQGNRLWALALSAEQANKTVTVYLDDTLKDVNGDCLVVWLYM